jgi:hypothetical protein
MDQDAIKIRTALIERVRERKGEPIFYSDLVDVAGVRLILDLEEDRLRLIQLLTEIFLYEHNAQPRRPLLTIMAIYKRTGDHGGEFYKLVTKYGYEKDLKTNVAAMLKRFKAVVEFWCDDHKYQLYKDVSEATQ